MSNENENEIFNKTFVFAIGWWEQAHSPMPMGESTLRCNHDQNEPKTMLNDQKTSDFFKDIYVMPL